MSVTTQSVDIPLPQGGTMKGYLARPEGEETLPGVLVFMEIFGVNSHIRDVTERIAAEGFVALAPDYFHRTGAGMELNYDDDGMAEGMSHLGQLQADQMISDAQTAKDFLEARGDVGGAGIGAIGFCIGGHMTYLAACETGLKAAASFYGGGIAAPAGPGGGASTLSRTSGISGRIECYFGQQDSMIPMEQVEAVREALEGAGTAHGVHVYPDADHGFNCDQRGTFHAASAEDAWARSLALFNSELRD
ncbi:MAG: dienelactone hydrolase family protein [Myxococcota bacterium]|nr:carboxymethylenebutenolidase [Spirochaeta sp.]RPG07240.1 MAG: dienelactone hydrolase family protein [Proteobacteria bacterium TMED72]